MKLANLSKILKCAGNDDAITMKSEDNGDTITFTFESQSERAFMDQRPRDWKQRAGHAAQAAACPAWMCRHQRQGSLSPALLCALSKRAGPGPGPVQTKSGCPSST